MYGKNITEIDRLSISIWFGKMENQIWHNNFSVNKITRYFVIKFYINWLGSKAKCVINGTVFVCIAAILLLFEIDDDF